MCIESRIVKPPCESQLIAISERLENRCWRSIPSINRIDLFGVFDGPKSEEQIVNERFERLTKIVDDLFEFKDDAVRKRQAQDPLELILASLPAIFTKNEDFWPTKRFVKNLLYMNTLEKFTESTTMMSLVSLC